MKTENLSIGLRVLYHAIEWLTVFTAPVCLPWA